MFPKGYGKFAVWVVFYACFNCIIDMFIKLVFVWDDFRASTLHNVAVEQHPYTSKDETFVYINACILY